MEVGRVVKVGALSYLQHQNFSISCLFFVFGKIGKSVHWIPPLTENPDPSNRVFGSSTVFEVSFVVHHGFSHPC